MYKLIKILHTSLLLHYMFSKKNNNIYFTWLIDPLTNGDSTPHFQWSMVQGTSAAAHAALVASTSWKNIGS